jgi:DNA invertase Pin-like site-specific DNA recombinase
MKKYVAYYRVSTTRQGQSGLGLDAQRATVNEFVRDGCLVAEFEEVESGKKNNRAKLSAAIEEAKRQGAKLLIAKLDRLSRNASFIFTLRDSGVDFICCDLPDANTLSIGLFAIIAQHERETTSQRTKAALAAKKARGFKLGSPVPMREDVIRMGQQIHKQNARENERNIQATDVILDKRAMGWTYQRIAEHLNNKKYKTRRGCHFNAAGVLRLERATKEFLADSAA